MEETIYLVGFNLQEVEALLTELDKLPAVEGSLLELKHSLSNIMADEATEAPLSDAEFEEVDYSNLESFWKYESCTARKLMESAAPLSEFMSELWLVSFDEVRKKLSSLRAEINLPEFDAYAEKLLVELKEAEEEDRLMDEFLEGDFT